MENGMNGLFTLLGQAIFERMARGGVDQGGQNWQAPMPYPQNDDFYDKNHATTPWESKEMAWRGDLSRYQQSSPPPAPVSAGEAGQPREKWFEEMYRALGQEPYPYGAPKWGNDGWRK